MELDQFSTWHLGSVGGVRFANRLCAESDDGDCGEGTDEVEDEVPADITIVSDVGGGEEEGGEELDGFVHGTEAEACE